MSKTKVNLLIALLIGAFSVPANAQWSVGVEAGLSHNTLTYDTGYYYHMNYNSSLGVSVAIPVQYQFNDWFALRAGVTYIQKSYNYHKTGFTKDLEERTTNGYLDIPLVARFSFGGERLRGFFDAGVYAGAWLHSWREGTTYETFTEETANASGSILTIYEAYRYSEPYEFDSTRDNRFDVGLLVGAGLQYQVSDLVALTLTCRYYYGLTDMQRNYMRNQYPRYHNTIVTNIGVMFSL